MSRKKKGRPRFLALVEAEMEARQQHEAEQAEQPKKENPRD